MSESKSAADAGLVLLGVDLSVPSDNWNWSKSADDYWNNYKSSFVKRICRQKIKTIEFK